MVLPHFSHGSLLPQKRVLSLIPPNLSLPHKLETIICANPPDGISWKINNGKVINILWVTQCMFVQYCWWRVRVSAIMGPIYSASNLLHLCLLNTPDRWFDFSLRASGVHSAYTCLCKWGCMWGELQGHWFFKDNVLASGEQPNIAAIPGIERLP